jgi:hypothetical protein
MIASKWHAHVRTEEIEELLLARMHPVLEHISISLGVKIGLLEQNLGLVIDLLEQNLGLVKSMTA